MFDGWMKPVDIKRELDKRIIGQEEAKRTLSVAVYNHGKRYFMNKYVEDKPGIGKSNILLIGPTGTGKTEIARALAEIVKVPFASVDATTLTEAGYVGDDVEVMLRRLWEAANEDVQRAARGIIYIDEFDKLSARAENRSITRDVSGEGVQQALLRIIEGTVSSFPVSGARKHPYGNNIEIDTSGILFICGGAFDGLDSLIRERIGANKKNIGFGSPQGKAGNLPEDADVLSLVEPEDLVRYGMLPEILGRLSVTATLEPLNEDLLRRILTEPENAICKQYIKMFRIEDNDLEFTEDAFQEIAFTAFRRKCGARGLRTMIEKVLRDPMFDIPQMNGNVKCIVTAEAVRGEAPPRYVPIKKKESKPA